MKKIVSLLVFFSLLLNFFALLSFAEEADNFQGKPDEDIGSITLCEYLPDRRSIHICGTINHEKLIEYNSYSFAVYKLPYGAGVDEAISSKDTKPVLTSEMSVKFDFLVSEQSFDDRFAQYVVAIFDEYGNQKIVDSPKYALCQSEYSFNRGDKSAYKGAAGSHTSLMTSSSVSSSIVTVEIDKLVNDSSVGYMYSNKDIYLNFDKEYIESLDRRINPLLACGADVYLRFQFKFSATTELPSVTFVEDGDLYIPDMSRANSRKLISAYTDFLTDRYSTRYLGDIRGIILGREIDVSYGRSPKLAIEKYADNYAYLAFLVSQTAHDNISDIEISIPFSDVNTYFGYVEGSSILCPPSTLLENICSSFDAGFALAFPFSVHIESDAIPYAISDETIASGDFSSNTLKCISADKAETYENYLISLNTKYKYTPSNFIFEWSVPQGISENVLSCAYVYSYMLLLSRSRLSSFVVSFEECEKEGTSVSSEYLFGIIKGIDTRDFASVIEPQRKMLGNMSWSEIVGHTYSGNINYNKYVELENLEALPDNIVGSFDYFNYDLQTSVSQWYMGSGADSIKLQYSNLLGRSLLAHFGNATTSSPEFSEIYYSYEFAENFVFTRYLLLSFAISPDTADPYALYEVRLTLGSDDTQAEESIVVRADELAKMTLDVSEFSDSSMATFIKIGIRPLSHLLSPFSIYVSSIKGYSEQYTNEELTSLINEERARIRNLQGNENDGGDNGALLEGVLIIIGVAIVGGLGIFLSIKKEDTQQ